MNLKEGILKFGVSVKTRQTQSVVKTKVLTSQTSNISLWFHHRLLNLLHLSNTC